MKIIYTLKAEDDLKAIGDYISLDSPRRATSFVDEIMDKIDTLVVFPLMFELAPHDANKNIRRMPHENYIVFYQVENEMITILHILHGARDFEALVISESD